MIKEISWEIYLDPDIGVSGLSAGLCAMSQQIFEPRTVLDNLESVIAVETCEVADARCQDGCCFSAHVLCWLILLEIWGVLCTERTGMQSNFRSVVFKKEVHFD